MQFIRNKMKNNNDWIQILNYINKKTIDFLNKKKKKNIELH